MNTNPSKPQDPASKPAPDDGVQGEGNYEAARRHRQSAEDFVASHDVQAEAREAAPDSAEEAEELRRAEQEGRSHAKE